MTQASKLLQGWVIVGWSALGISTMVATILAVYGAGEEGIGTAIRATARTSFFLFISAFSASALYNLRAGSITRWLRQNRRYLGVSFAVSHTFHALAIVTLAVITSGQSMGRTDRLELAGGLLAYVFIAAMVATSFDRTAAWLGKRWWGILHTTSMYYLWAIFMFSYGGRAVFSNSYRPLAGLLLLALVLRLVAARKPKGLAAAKSA